MNEGDRGRQTGRLFPGSTAPPSSSQRTRSPSRLAQASLHRASDDADSTTTTSSSSSDPYTFLTGRHASSSAATSDLSTDDGDAVSLHLSDGDESLLVQRPRRRVSAEGVEDFAVAAGATRSAVRGGSLPFFADAGSPGGRRKEKPPEERRWAAALAGKGRDPTDPAVEPLPPSNLAELVPPTRFLNMKSSSSNLLMRRGIERTQLASVDAVVKEEATEAEWEEWESAVREMELDEDDRAKRTFLFRSEDAVEEQRVTTTLQPSIHRTCEGNLPTALWLAMKQRTVMDVLFLESLDLTRCDFGRYWGKIKLLLFGPEGGAASRALRDVVVLSLGRNDKSDLAPVLTLERPFARWECQQITTLYLDGCGFEEVPAFLTASSGSGNGPLFPRITRFSLHDNRLRKIPGALLRNMPAVVSLYLSFNDIDTLPPPEDFACLRALEQLFLQTNKLTNDAIRGRFEVLPAIEVLDLSLNESLEDIRDELEDPIRPLDQRSKEWYETFDVIEGGLPLRFEPKVDSGARAFRNLHQIYLNGCDKLCRREGIVPADIAIACRDLTRIEMVPSDAVGIQRHEEGRHVGSAVPAGGGAELASPMLSTAAVIATASTDSLDGWTGTKKYRSSTGLADRVRTRWTRPGVGGARQRVESLIGEGPSGDLDDGDQSEDKSVVMYIGPVLLAHLYSMGVIVCVTNELLMLMDRLAPVIPGLMLCAQERDALTVFPRMLQRQLNLSNAVREVDSEGRNCLHEACRLDNADMAAALVAHGTRFLAMDKGKRTPAELIGYEKLVEVRHPHPFYGNKLGRLFLQSKERSVAHEHILLIEAAYDAHQFEPFFECGEVCSEYLRVKATAAMAFLQAAERLLVAVKARIASEEEILREMREHRNASKKKEGGGPRDAPRSDKTAGRQTRDRGFGRVNWASPGSPDDIASTFTSESLHTVVKRLVGWSRAIRFFAGELVGTETERSSGNECPPASATRSGADRDAKLASLTRALREKRSEKIVVGGLVRNRSLVEVPPDRVPDAAQETSYSGRRRVAYETKFRPTTVSTLRWQPHAYDVLVLHAAAVKGDATSVAELVEAGPVFFNVDEHGRTALHLAAAWGNAAVAKVLVERVGVALHDVAMRSRGPPPLRTDGRFTACDAPFPPPPPGEVRMGGGESITIDRWINTCDLHGYPALYYAIRAGHVDVVNVLLEAGADTRFDELAERQGLCAPAASVLHRVTGAAYAEASFIARRMANFSKMWKPARGARLVEEHQRQDCGGDIAGVSGSGAAAINGGLGPYRVPRPLTAHAAAILVLGNTMFIKAHANDHECHREALSDYTGRGHASMTYDSGHAASSRPGRRGRGGGGPENRRGIGGQGPEGIDEGDAGLDESGDSDERSFGADGSERLGRTTSVGQGIVQPQPRQRRPRKMMVRGVAMNNPMDDSNVHGTSMLGSSSSSAHHTKFFGYYPDPTRGHSDVETLYPMAAAPRPTPGGREEGTTRIAWGMISRLCHDPHVAKERVRATTLSFWSSFLPYVVFISVLTLIILDHVSSVSDRATHAFTAKESVRSALDLDRNGALPSPWGQVRNHDEWWELFEANVVPAFLPESPATGAVRVGQFNTVVGALRLRTARTEPHECEREINLPPPLDTIVGEGECFSRFSPLREATEMYGTNASVCLSGEGAVIVDESGGISPATDGTPARNSSSGSDGESSSSSPSSSSSSSSSSSDADADADADGSDLSDVCFAWRDVPGSSWRSRVDPDVRFTSDGYIVDLDVSKPAAARRVIGRLKDGGFLDRATRAVFVEMAMVNLDAGLLLRGTLGTEFPIAGGADVSDRIVAVKIRHSSLAFLLDLVALVFVLVYAWGEIKDMRREGHYYLFNQWNVLDVVLIVIFLVVEVYRWQLYSVGAPFATPDRDAPLASPSTYFGVVDEYMNAFMSGRNALAALLIVAWTKVIKFGTKLPHLGRAVSAFAGTITDRRVVLYGVFVVAISWATALGAHVLLGAESDRFKTLASAMMAMSEALVCADVTEDDGLSPARAMVIMEIVLHVIVINMFVGVISSVYMERYIAQGDTWHAELTRTFTFHFVKHAARAQATVRGAPEDPSDSDSDTDSDSGGSRIGDSWWTTAHHQTKSTRYTVKTFIRGIKDTLHLSLFWRLRAFLTGFGLDFHPTQQSLFSFVVTKKALATESVRGRINQMQPRDLMVRGELRVTRSKDPSSAPVEYPRPVKDVLWESDRLAESVWSIPVGNNEIFFADESLHLLPGEALQCGFPGSRSEFECSTNGTGDSTAGIV